MKRYLAAAMLLLALSGCGSSGSSTQLYTTTEDFFAMDTYMSVDVSSEKSESAAEDMAVKIEQRVNQLDAALSRTQQAGDLYKLNHANGQPTEVSDDTYTALEKALEYAEMTDGAFDPTLGKVIRLWDIDGEDPHVPETSELDALLKDVGYQKVTLDGNKVTLAEDTTLDLGAVGKGIGCDVISDFLKDQKEVEGMILNLGGSSVFAYGHKPDDSPWKVAVTDPRDTEGDYLGVITLEGGEFLSTSGDYEKYFMEDGKRYHHILDPKTGYPVWNGLDSVTVICDSGLLADGLSTACFVLGREDALKLLEKYNAEAAFVDEDKNVYLTDGLKDRFELMKNTYTVKDAE